MDRPRLDLAHLQMLVAIVEAGTLGEAAGRLGVTASALSHRIREAERRLDVRLFERAGRRLRLTPAGELLHQAAGGILDELAQVERIATRMGAGVRHVVRLTVGTYPSYHWLPGFLARLRDAMPDTEVEVVADAVARPLAALQEGEIDLAIMAGFAVAPGFATVPLFTDRTVAVMAPDHPLAGRTFLEAADFAPHDLFTYSLQSVPGGEVDRFWRPARASPRRIVKVELIEAIVELVKAGLGLALLSNWALAPRIASGELVAAELTRSGLDVEWQAVLRPGTTGASERVAALLANWCDGRPPGSIPGG